MCTTRSDLFGWAGRKQISCPAQFSCVKNAQKKDVPHPFFVVFLTT